MKILVSRLKFIGDMILTTPVIGALRDKFPESEIDYLGDKDGVTLLEHNPNLNEIIPYDFDAPSVKEQLRVALILRKKKYDAAIDLFGNPRSAIAIFLSGAKMRIGGDFGWRGKTYTHPIVINERINSIAFHLRYLRPLGIEESYRQPKVFLSDTEVHDAAEFLASLGIDNSGMIIGLHIGATWPAKMWLPEHFGRLAELVNDELGAQVIVTYGPADKEYFERFAASTHSQFSVVPPQAPKRLRKLAAAISQCDAFVSNDTSPMHISAAVGTATVGIFGPSEPEIWFPYDKNLGHVAFKKDVQCCRRDICKLEGEEYMRCMKLIRPEEVFEALQQILKIKHRADK
ncbi:MAG: glycosyltransferase family 9 protein [Bacteroidetes bacterium]|nr:glycosyltransferase family 9 protein [Bacteroidota bacterium]MCL5739251.1 glycosyltransferase family 9 protein [Bacteroidota bacterium]